MKMLTVILTTPNTHENVDCYPNKQQPLMTMFTVILTTPTPHTDLPTQEYNWQLFTKTFNTEEQ